MCKFIHIDSVLRIHEEDLILHFTDKWCRYEFERQYSFHIPIFPDVSLRDHL